MFLNSGSDIVMIETTAVPVINHGAISWSIFSTNKWIEKRQQNTSS